MQRVVLLAGVPGSGKSWICKQLQDKFCHVAHDDYQDGGYVQALYGAARHADQAVLAETPFSVSEIVRPLENRGVRVDVVFVVESPEVTRTRYVEREGKEIPQGHLTRIDTYRRRAREWNCFIGTSSEVLKYLNGN